MHVMSLCDIPWAGCEPKCRISGLMMACPSVTFRGRNHDDSPERCSVAPCRAVPWPAAPGQARLGLPRMRRMGARVARLGRQPNGSAHRRMRATPPTSPRQPTSQAPARAPSASHLPVHASYAAGQRAAAAA